MNNFNKNELAAKLKPFYQALIDEVPEAKSEEYIKFCIQWGRLYPTEKNTGLMFYGRANNGWVCFDTTVEDIFDPNNPDRAFDRDDQMQWVDECAGDTNGYNSNKSAFWRVIKNVSKAFYPNDELQHIVWSNLCKIAPDGQNPSDALYYAQLPSACEIMKTEIEFFSPRHVVLLTGEGWAMPFLKKILGTDEPTVVGSEIFGGSNEYEIKVYEKDNVFYYVSEHPQGKDESTHIESLVKLIRERSNTTK
ncbi:MAG: hypothetical protein HDT08_03960 [Bacteroidales bacterium]|nr:hypothetical protein [Bacteroidales bacterium]